MARPTITEHNLATGEVFEREMNDEEFATYEAVNESYKANLVAAAEKAAKKAELLAKLGITEDDAKLLLS